VFIAYCPTPRTGGALYGEGKGIMTSKDGQEMVTFTGPGRIRFAGSVL